MRKSDFIKIQTALRDGQAATLAVLPVLPASVVMQIERTYAATCKDVAAVLATTNPKFKADRFMQGCSVRK